MKFNKTAGRIAGIGFAGLIFAGVAAPAMAADSTASSSSTYSAAATQPVASPTNSDDWGPEDHELGTTIRVVNNTNETITVSIDQSDAEISGSKTLAPGESMWAYNYQSGNDLTGSITIGTDSISIKGKQPSCGTPSLTIDGTRYESDANDISVKDHKLSVSEDGEAPNYSQRWTITVSS